MSLRDDISRDVTASLKAGEKEKLSALRMLLSAVKYKEVDLRRPLTDPEVHQVVSTLLRQRQDSIDQFRKGNRLDLAEKEEREAEILKAYMPAQLSAEELRQIIKKAASEAGAKGPGDMGKLMKAVMPHVKGKADGKLVNDIVREVLGG
ncbi:MAG: GatB/YqeY domain-containing protein [Deltaproteobacteria bacterium]|nr:GatB/YqeY domain-containing protein [Deltaproteobacteria bacterium]